MPSEAQARITINKMLEEAGWRFLPDSQGRRENIICEHRVTRRAFSPSQDLGKDFEHAPNGFVDYILLNTDQRPVAVTEAKRERIDPLTGKESARGYAEGLGVSHVFLSNGLVHYCWNLRQGNPVKVSRFLPLEQLGKAEEWKPDPARVRPDGFPAHHQRRSAPHHRREQEGHLRVFRRRNARPYCHAARTRVAAVARHLSNSKTSSAQPEESEQRPRKQEGSHSCRKASTGSMLAARKAG